MIACRFFLELSEEETAAALDIRPGTVKSRTSRALEHLREAYAELETALRELGAALEFPPPPTSPRRSAVVSSGRAHGVVQF